MVKYNKRNALPQLKSEACLEVGKSLLFILEVMCKYWRNGKNSVSQLLLYCFSWLYKTFPLQKL